jgi:hypothetical protein
MSNETALAKVEDYNIVRMEPEQFTELLDENLGGASVDPFSLDVVKVPSGGGLSWTIPTISGEQDTREITGILVYWDDVKAFWRESLENTGGGTPPDCRGFRVPDERGLKIFHGFGDPGITCSACEYDQFGSGKNGGKACKDMRLLFMLREKDVLPLVIQAPATSLAPITKYFRGLLSAGKPYYSVITKLTLVRQENKGGIKYGQIAATMVGEVPEAALGKVRGFKNYMESSVKEAQARAAAFASGLVEAEEGLQAPEEIPSDSEIPVPTG